MDNEYHSKIIYLILTIILFSIAYSIMKPKHFHGLNKVQDKIKDELLEDEVKDELLEDEVKEPFLESYYPDIDKDIDKEIAKEDIKDVVEDEEKKISKPTYTQRYLDSLYFSIITSCLLGYGDIYPTTNVAKVLVSIQAMITLGLILY